MRHFIFVLVVGGGMLLAVIDGFCDNGVNPSIVPKYVTAGLSAYERDGYEAAVRTWLAAASLKNAVDVAVNNSFFRNIQQLAGRYQSYDILMTKETNTSNMVYVRMNFERLPGYILFVSAKQQGRWVLVKIQPERRQSFGQG